MKYIRQRQIYDIAYMQNLKKKKMQVNLLTRQKQTQRLREENKLMGTYGYQGKGIDSKFRIDMYTLLSVSNLRPLQ